MEQAFYQIYLDLTLYNFAEDKFVLAHIWADGLPMGLSPVTVPHLSNGRYFYTDASIFFPSSKSEVVIQYEVFNDALFTIRSKCHAPAKETFRRFSDQALIDKINQFIMVETSGLIYEDTMVVGEVLDDTIVGELSEDQTIIIGLILEDETENL